MMENKEHVNNDVTAAMIGFNMFGQCVDFQTEEKLEDTFVTFKMKILDIIYTCTIPKEDMLVQSNVEAAWQGLLKEFFIRHAVGNNKIFKHGSRELSADEKEAAETKKRAKKAGLIL